MNSAGRILTLSALALLAACAGPISRPSPAADAAACPAALTSTDKVRITGKVGNCECQIPHCGRGAAPSCTVTEVNDAYGHHCECICGCIVQ